MALPVGNRTIGNTTRGGSIRVSSGLDSPAALWAPMINKGVGAPRSLSRAARKPLFSENRKLKPGFADTGLARERRETG